MNSRAGGDNGVANKRGEVGNSGADLKSGSITKTINSVGVEGGGATGADGNSIANKKIVSSVAGIGSKGNFEDGVVYGVTGAQTGKIRELGGGKSVFNVDRAD